MSQSSVYDVLQDRRGFVWFATQDGLNRYDGRDFKVYKSIPFDSTSFASNWIWSIAEGPDGSIWTGSQLGGVGRFDPTTGRVVRYRHDPNDSTSLSHDFVFTVEVGSDGSVWAGTQNGLNHLDPATGSITAYHTDGADSTSLSSNFVSAIHEDSQGRLWIGTLNGLNRFHPETGTFTRYLDQEPVGNPGARFLPGTVADIEQDLRDANILWLTGGFGLARFDVREGTHRKYAPPGEFDLVKLSMDPALPGVMWASSDGGGLMRFDSRTESFNVFAHDARDPASVGSNALFAIESDRTGMMWVGSQSLSGVAKFDPSSARFTNYKHRAADASSLPNDLIWGIYVPPSRPYEVWSVHQMDPQRSHDRLARLDRRSGTVEQYVHDPSDPTSLGKGQIPARLEDARGRLWIATIGGGLNLFDPGTRRFRRFVHDERPTSISSNFVSSLAEGSDGTLWIGTFGGGLNRMSSDEPGVFERIPESSDDSTGFIGDVITPGSLALAGDGSVWVGTNEGLNHVDPETGRIESYRHDPSDPGSLAAAAVSEVRLDATGAVWAVTTASGEHVLNRLQPGGTRWVRYRHNPADPNSLGDNRISALYERSQEPGVMWVGTPAGGLTRVDPSSDSLIHYTEANGLPNNFVYGILGDDNGNLWLSTNNGLSRFNPETGAFRNFDVDDGLLSREFNSNAFFRSATGEMFFGSVAGVTAFDPVNIQPNPIPPEVVLTDFKLFNRSVLPGAGSVLTSPLAETEEIRLAHWQKTVTFDFVALHFRNPEKNTYSYMLEGFDDDWVAAGSQRSATYTNLDPGRYVFRVRAANSDGVWNEEGASMALVISPPFWKTAWFRLFAILSLAGMGMSLYRTRVRQIKARNRQLEDQVAARTAELRSKNAQLEQSHAIVRAINAETAFESLLNAVLAQAKVIPGVEKASALVYDAAADAYVFRASVGWDVARLAPIRMSRVEAGARYTDHAQEVARDIFLERNVADRPGHAILSEIGTPKSMLVLRIRSGDVHGNEGDADASGRADGYIILDNMHDQDAFERQDLELLDLLREHVRSAFVKTRLLEDVNRSLEHLKTTQSQLIQAEKMASLGQLTAGIAHEIKNPLNFVNNFASLCAELADELQVELRERGVVDSEIDEILGDLRTNSAKIQEHGKRADGIVRSMLKHSQGKSGEMQKVDLNVLLEEYVSLAYHGARARDVDFNVAIDRSFDPAVGRLRLIPQEMGRVFINLLDNAFYAVHERTRSANGEYVPRVTVETLRSDNDVQIRVADNGSGIPESVRKRIFEPFYTTKPTGEGTGLGLSMTYDIITQVHGGTIAVDSREGEGTTFTITIPAS